jgi:hypothetical protein
MRRPFALFLLLGLAACGSAASSSADQRFTTTVAAPIVSTPTTPSTVTGTPSSTTPPPGLPPLPDAIRNDPLVVFQANWLCESSKTAYASAADIESALGVRLASAGVDRAAYDGFVASLDRDAAKRAGVLQLFLQTCH